MPPLRSRPSQSSQRAPSPAGALARSLVWCGPVFEPTGYADEVRGMIEGLDALKTPVRLHPTNRESPGFRATLPPTVRATLERAIALPVSEPLVMVQHATIDSFGVVGQNVGYSIGRSMFETDGLPSHWVHGANALDELWVTGEFNRSTFAAAGVRVPMHIIPGGIDSTFFQPAAQPKRIAGTRGTVFLSVFEWRLRKGWDALLRAWANAFGPDDDVTLVLRTYPISQVDAQRNNDVIWDSIDTFLREHCGGRTRRDIAPIIVLGDRVAAADLPALYSMASAFVLPTRGEGWGRPFMESMACGVPVIATNWSAHTAFMNAENSYLVDVDGLVPADHSEIAAYIGQRWAEPSVQHLEQQMQRVHSDRAEARAIGGRARVDMVSEWPWSRAAEAVQRRLHDINGELDRMSFAVPAMASSTATNVALPAFVVEGETGATSQSTTNTASWLSAIAANDPSMMSWRVAHPGARPSYSSSAYAWWRRANVCNATLGVHLTVLTDDARAIAPVRPATGVWVVDVGSAITGEVPPHLVTTLRDQADAIVVPHDAARDACLAIDIDAERIEIITPYVDTQQFSPDGASYRRGTHAGTRFLVIGGDLPHRALQHVVSTYERTFTSADDVVLHVVLPLAQRDENTAWRQQLLSLLHAGTRHPRLPRIFVDTQRIEREELPALFRAADVFIHAGSATGAGRTIREAMACGVPVIATDIAPARDLLNDGSGWLVPAGPQGFATDTSLAAALRSACKASERQQAGATARARADRWANDDADGAIRRAYLQSAATRTPRTTMADHPLYAAPFVLEGARNVVMLVHADWHSGMLPAVVRGYANAITAQDDVTLAVCLDPVQGVSVEQAGSLIEHAVKMAGCTDITTPDVLLVPDRLDVDTLQQLRARADIVIAVRDAVSAAAAHQLGKRVLPSLHADSWRAVLDQHLSTLTDAGASIS